MEKHTTEVSTPSQSQKIYKTPILVAGILIAMAVSFVGGYKAQNITIGPLKPATSDVDFSSLNTVYEVLARKFDGPIDKSKILEGAKAGLVAAAGDPFTTYLDKEAAKELDDDLKGQLSGIGAEIAIKSSKLTVVAPIADSPADKSGMRSGDVIIKINDQDTGGLTLEQAVSKIRGPKDTIVKLMVIRGSEKPKELTITRDTLTITSVKWSMKSATIGYINITRFGTDTATKTREAAKDLVSKGAKKIVLDLRNDPGGYLTAAVSVA